MVSITKFLVMLCVVAMLTHDADAFGSANLKSGVMASISKMKHGMESMMEKLKKSVPQIPSLGGEAQASLAKQGEQMKNLENSAKQDIPIPTGLDEAQATEMTQTKEAAKDVKSELEGMTIPSMPAMTEEQEKSLATAEVDLKAIQNDMSAPIAAPIPTIPPEVVNALAAMAVDTKYFEGRPVPKISKPTATSALGAQSANALMQKATIFKPHFRRQPMRRPVAPAQAAAQAAAPAEPAATQTDTTGTGGEAAKSNVASKEITDALNRATKHISRLTQQRAAPAPAPAAAPAYYPPYYPYYPFPTPAPAQQPQQFSPGAEHEIAKLSKQMKTLTTTLAALKSPSQEQKKKVEQQVQTNQKIQQLEHQLRVVSAPAPKAASPKTEDITAAKVKVISELVSNLDELGRAFGEDELVEEDQILNEKEDPVASLIRSDLQSGVKRIENSLQQNPAPFHEHRHLRHIGHTIAYPQKVGELPETDNMDSLQYLKDLKQHIISLKEQDMKSRL